MGFAGLLLFGLLLHPRIPAYTTACDVYTTGGNLARNGTASQSSTISHSINPVAERSIDGNRNGDFLAGSCSHTNEESSPWWSVDLKQVFQISCVIVVNRQECCTEQLMDAEVRVGIRPNNKNPVCGTISNVTGRPIIAIDCSMKEARYVTVIIPGRTGKLHICEVEVYGVASITTDVHVCW